MHSPLPWHSRGHAGMQACRQLLCLLTGSNAEALLWPSWMGAPSSKQAQDSPGNALQQEAMSLHHSEGCSSLARLASGCSGLMAGECISWCSGSCRSWCSSGRSGSCSSASCPGGCCRPWCSVRCSRPGSSCPLPSWCRLWLGDSSAC